MSQKWVTNKDAEFYCGGQKAIELYNAKITQRRAKYGNIEKSDLKEYESLINDIETKGYTKIPGFFKKEEIEPIKEEFLAKIEKKEDIVSVQQESFIQVVEPFLNMETVFHLSIRRDIVDIATAYYKCAPALGTCNMRRSSPLYTKKVGTNLFHRDFNSPVKFIKFFIYLDDVSECHGPFTYVEASNTRMPKDWNRNHRWSDEEIVKMYGKDSIKRLTANYGDLIIATTNGFHKGEVPVCGNRDMLTLNYVISPELKSQSLDQESKRFLINKRKCTNLKNWQKPLVDFLEIIE